MSKRKNRNSAPNLPQDTLDRARQQLGKPEGEPETAPEKAPEKVRPTASARRASSGSTRRRATGDTAIQFSQRRKKDAPLDPETIQYMLAHPTKQVSEETLRAEYSYVLADLRSMAILAAGLMIALILVALFL